MLSKFTHSRFRIGFIYLFIYFAKYLLCNISPTLDGTLNFRPNCMEKAYALPSSKIVAMSAISRGKNISF